MKKNILYIALFAVMMGFCSCSDFLDKYPQEELSDASFWKTPKDAEMFVANIYKVLPGGDAGDIDGEINSDNAVHGIKWAAGNVSKGIYDAADTEWASSYASIRACNVLLEKIEMIEDYPVADKEATIGEARFLRGYVYFGLIQTFGDVPYIDKALALDEMEGITRTPRAEVYAKIMQDFDFAISKLPQTWSDDS